ncbi:chitin-binding type-2 domain-containing protein, partial [Trichonephila inaurata madagascariensis]
KPPVDKEPVTEEDLPTLKPPKNPSLKLLWLVMSSMMAVQEGSCQYCPTHNGLYPNIENCKCYYKCIEGRPIQKWCPPGQKFDVMSMSCSFPSKTVCAGSLIHMLPAMMANYQQQGPNNNVIQQVTPPLITNDGHQPPVIQQHGNKGHVHITLNVQKPNGGKLNGGEIENEGGNGGGMQMQGNMMQLMQMLMMMMQQGMNGNMNMNMNMNQQNGKMGMMNMQNMMNNNNMMMMNQGGGGGNMMNQGGGGGGKNMNQGGGGGGGMMNMNQGGGGGGNMMQPGGGQPPQCQNGCQRPKKQITLVYDLHLNKFPIRFKLFG